MSTKELVIELRIPLVGNMFEDAAVITKVGDITEAMRNDLFGELGGDGFLMTVETKTKRAPKSTNGAAPVGRVRKAKEPAATADAPAT